MPFIYAVEMLCNYLGAAHAYWGKSFSYTAEYDWWNEKRKIAKMHPSTKDFITHVLRELAECEKCDYFINKILQYDNLLLIYQKYNQNESKRNI